MPIDDSTTRSVVFIVERASGETQGTGFFVTMPSSVPGGKPHGYLVTAGHNVVGLNEENTAIRFRTSADRLETRRLEANWHVSEVTDLAVTPIVPEEENYQGLSMDLASDALGIRPRLGGVVFFMGLFKPSAKMDVEARPVVRGGIFSAWSVAGLTHDVWHTSFDAHLVDVRSYGGFSGSPVFLRHSWPGPRDTMIDPIPRQWLRLDDRPEHPESFGTIYYVTALMGVFVAHHGKTGIGLVVPVEDVRQELMRPVFLDGRLAADKQKGGLNE